MKAEGLEGDPDQPPPPGDDLDSILSQFASLDASNDTATTTVLLNPPAPRANLSLTSVGGSGGGSDVFVIYGGEYYDGATNVCNSDVFTFDPVKKMWKEHGYSGLCPPPRCSHQSVVFNGGLYVFGGELAGVDVYHHYHDFWRLDLKTYKWAKQAPNEKNRPPSPRSGHRMFVWRGYIVLFGGFFEQVS